MSEPLQARIASALSSVVNPRTGQDVVSSEMVRDIATTLGGKVRLTFLLGAQDPASLVREVRRAVEGVEDVQEVRVDVKDPAQVAPRPSGPRAPAAPSTSASPTTTGAPVSSPTPGAGGPGRGRSLPVMGQEAPKSRAAGVPAPTPVSYPNLGRVIAVSSGKGGVGKSTVATNIAVALASGGARVGLMDADIYGPNIPRMMGVASPPPVDGNRIMPHEAHGVKLMSLGFIIERDQPAIWRGPIVMKVITQFLADVDWGELDYLVVDMPPGTGDAQLSLVQATHVHGAIIVTTPQEVAVGDALRGAKMFERVNVPVLGIIENMSYFSCPHCGKPTPLFGSGGGSRLADELRVPLLGEIPIHHRVAEGGDSGTPIVALEPDSPAARALRSAADRVAESATATVGA